MDGNKWRVKIDRCKNMRTFYAANANHRSICAPPETLDRLTTLLVDNSGTYCSEGSVDDCVQRLNVELSREASRVS